MIRGAPVIVYGGLRSIVSTRQRSLPVAASGALRWRFYTGPGNPADGFENDAMKMGAGTWTGEWWR